ncbi:hypothetical protein PROFUN_09566 [Planoprotostelium fungivorum]|uniref:Uncharacterized protein n=1 Tax=Planoprotostelium fungivorum TaxID=1890364 RepID=A0A2P6NGQ8_9EUKA|nr:hypothetical protein PROFUN_09566 [Planoprotostelium fungivorum]
MFLADNNRDTTYKAHTQPSLASASQRHRLLSFTYKCFAENLQTDLRKQAFIKTSKKSNNNRDKEDEAAHSISKSETPRAAAELRTCRDGLNVVTLTCETVSRRSLR